jgi:hypothetical protein
MVSYIDWTEVVFDVVDGRAEATEVVSWAAEQWRENKSGLKAASKSEARQWAQNRL